MDHLIGVYEHEMSTVFLWDRHQKALSYNVIIECIFVCVTGRHVSIVRGIVIFKLSSVIP